MASTVVDKLLNAAAELDREGKPSFTAEDLVVKAWRLYPNTFGLAGYTEDGRAQFPDSNRVFAEIMGSKPIRSRGFLVKTGSKLYSITPTGREHAARIGVTSETRQAALSREVRQHLAGLLGSRAFQKYARGEVDRVSFSDAAQFFGVSARSTAIEFQGRVSAVRATIESAIERARGSDLRLDNAGGAVRQDQLQLAAEFSDYLLARFKSDWDVLRTRKSER